MSEQQCNYWLFQYATKDDIGEVRKGSRKRWQANRRMLAGDKVVLWKPGADGGVFGFGKILSNPRARDFLTHTYSVDWQCLRRLRHPIPKGHLRRYRSLQAVAVVGKSFRGGVLRLNKQHWETIQSIASRGQSVRTFRERGPQKSNDTQCWIFQAHPKEDDLREFLKNRKAGSRLYWRVTRFKDPRAHVRPGDRVAMFQARGSEAHAAGIYALGVIAAPPERTKASWRVKVQLTHHPRVEQPISVGKLLGEKALRGLSVLRPKGAEGSNFRIERIDAWGAICALWGENPKERPGPPAPSPSSARVKAVAAHEMNFPERELVSAYVAHMRHKGFALEQEFHLPNSPSGLRCDLFLEKFHDGRRLVIEAKGDTSRESVRLAIGELLDYGRYVAPKSSRPRLAILLPGPIEGDLEELCSSLRIALIWRSNDEAFKDNSNGKLS